ncbi:MAG TPA: hypothetical protein EYG21_03150 [Nitrospinaceae bacterium]|nr:hypothetical protein [Nitrospinaceae bacterium]
MADQTPSLFRKLTQLFRSGPSIKRRVRSFDGKATAQSSLEQFKAAHRDVYSSTLSAYGAFDRMARYSDFSEMEATPEIASALDIYSEETASADEKGTVLHIYSENRKIRELLRTLFYDTLNLDFNLTMWVRNLCKYGDFFLFNDVSPEFGVIGAYPVPISEIEREEGYDPDDPTAVRFRWMTQGNQVLENWQITHFRLLANDAFLPYGSSVLDPARRIWRQLILIEDAMLVYRVIRAPERRVFYIDIGNVPPENAAEYLEQARASLKTNPVINKSDGRVDLRYNPLSVDEDYFIPVRGGDSGTKIESLAGGQNTAAIEDVEYIQKKMFAALKIPKAYLGYDEDIGAKATLAQEDIRFSRTIARIQKTVISELNKLAMIHLYAHGFTGEDLIDFELKLSNPSSIAQQQKLELISTRFDIAGKVPEGMVDKRWVRKNVLGLTDEEIDAIDEGMIEDAAAAAELEAAGAAPDTGGGGGDEGGGDLFAADIKDDADLLDGNLISVDRSSMREADDDDSEEDLDEDEIVKLSMDDEDGPVKVDNMVRNMWGEPLQKSRKETNSAGKIHSPDFASMTGVGSKTRQRDSMNQPYDRDFLKNPFGEGLIADLEKDGNFGESALTPRFNPSTVSLLSKLSKVISNNQSSLLKEEESGIDLEIIDENLTANNVLSEDDDEA